MRGVIDHARLTDYAGSGFFILKYNQKYISRFLFCCSQLACLEIYQCWCASAQLRMGCFRGSRSSLAALGRRFAGCHLTIRSLCFLLQWDINYIYIRMLTGSDGLSECRYLDVVIMEWDRCLQPSHFSFTLR